jgi:voltage-dependent potassium channel beta subunit
LEYRKVGRNGLRVSELGLGSWLTYGTSLDEQITTACIHKAYDLGINFFDTANVYGQGAAEIAVGKALKDFPRESYVLATKVFFPMGGGPNDRGLSRKHIFEQCHASLRRLGTDYIDLYQCHRFDTSVPLEETLWALDDLAAQGKILYSGVSEWIQEQILEGVSICEKYLLRPFISNQPRYNMFQREIENTVIPACERVGIGQVVFSPLAQGLLTGKYRLGEPVPEGSRATTQEGRVFIKRFLTEENLRKVEGLRQLAKEAGLTLPELALAWVLRLENISSAIIGASRPEQIDANVKAAEVHLSTEILEKIEQVLNEELISF